MGKFVLQKIDDNSLIQILAMNIDNDNNILVLENNELEILSLDRFKDMILGCKDGNAATHKLYSEQ